MIPTPQGPPEQKVTHETEITPERELSGESGGLEKPTAGKREEYEMFEAQLAATLALEPTERIHHYEKIVDQLIAELDG